MKWWKLQKTFAPVENQLLSSNISKGNHPGMYMLRSSERGAKAQLPESSMLYSNMESVTGFFGGVSAKFVLPIVFAAGRGGFS